MSDKDDGFGSAFFVGEQERNPLRGSRQPGEKPLPRRFYKVAVAAPAEGGFGVFLDGKPARTPARNMLILPGEGLATALAGEWDAQAETVDPAAMPLTRLANSAIDGVADKMDEVLGDVVKYAGSDLICYRAGEPAGLAKAQSAAWDPYVHFVREECGARLILSEGVVFHAQPEEALEAIAARISAYVGAGQGAPFRLAALHAMTTLTGSCVIALAAALRKMDGEAAFSAAHVDEDYQMRLWGGDEEAVARLTRRRADMLAAAEMSLFCAPA
ncbi:ATP12 family chaperone protein [Methylocystis heyeri]|uniref:ATPase n=1 Tax=Methylocystis heyeri TaxID=391905 RepID=A0A6B8KA96_9HYPH|nr:ATP12 family protein [Methylocystis heyeri]QGM45224.1 ATPase [Methylocystis heyeri]